MNVTETTTAGHEGAVTTADFSTEREPQTRPRPTFDEVVNACLQLFTETILRDSRYKGVTVDAIHDLREAFHNEAWRDYV